MTNAPQFLTDLSEIREWLDAYCNITDTITINSDGLVSVDGPVHFNYVAERSISRLMVQFDRVSGDFMFLRSQRLTTLAGSPRHVGGHCYFAGAHLLDSLIGAPTSVGGDFYCSHSSRITTLAGVPSYVGGRLDCLGCNLHTIDDLSIIKGSCAFTRSIKPQAATVLRLLQQRIQLVTPQRAKWISIVNDYYESGDLLTAIAQFEKYYKVPFIPADVTASVSNPVFDAPLC